MMNLFLCSLPVRSRQQNLSLKHSEENEKVPAQADCFVNWSLASSRAGVVCQISGKSKLSDSDDDDDATVYIDILKVVTTEPSTA